MSLHSVDGLPKFPLGKGAVQFTFLYWLVLICIHLSSSLPPECPHPKKVLIVSDTQKVSAESGGSSGLDFPWGRDKWGNPEVGHEWGP